MTRPSFYKGVGFMTLSATGMSLVGLFGKFGILNFSVAALMFWRYAASSLILVSILLFLRKLDGIFYFHHIKIQFIRAFFLLLAQYCFFYYLSQSNLLNASALLNTGPVFISIIEWGFLRKKVGVSTWIGVIISFIGALFILQPDEGMFALSSLIGLTAGISQGISQVVFGIQNEREEKPHIGVIHLFAICTIFSFVPFFFTHPKMVAGRDLIEWDCVIIFMIAATSILNQLFRAVAYSHGTPSRLSSYLYVSVLLAGVWDWTIFKNPPNAFSLLGAALIILGGVMKIYLRNWILKRRRMQRKKK